MCLKEKAGKRKDLCSYRLPCIQDTQNASAALDKGQPNGGGGSVQRLPQCHLPPRRSPLNKARWLTLLTCPSRSWLLSSLMVWGPSAPLTCLQETLVTVAPTSSSSPIRAQVRGAPQGPPRAAHPPWLFLSTVSRRHILFKKLCGCAGNRGQSRSQDKREGGLWAPFFHRSARTPGSCHLAATHSGEGYGFLTSRPLPPAR